MTNGLLSRLSAAGVRLGLNGDRLTLDAPVGVLTPDLMADLKNQKPQIIEALMELSYWTSRVYRAASRDQVLSIVDEFRPLPWTDEQRSQMSRAYVGRLENLANKEGSL